MADEIPNIGRNSFELINVSNKHGLRLNLTEVNLHLTEQIVIIIIRKLTNLIF